MKNQPNRLDIEQRHLLGGTDIDRNAPLQFRLNGRVIHGFKGDTVLSALLANGIDIVGNHAGHPIGLSARFAPPIALTNARQHALPMERTPAIDGAEFQTLTSNPSGSPFARLLSRLRRPKRSLGIDLDRPGAMSLPWLDLPSQETHTVDTVVIGGGVAGLSAALASAHAGHSVVLLEASPDLGGHARLFGTLEGEETPDHSIARLTAEIAATETITVITRAEAFAVRPGIVRAHLVTVEDHSASGKIIDYRATSIILASGAVERLPLFAGNRLPGVIGIQEAYDRAYRCGVWPGKTALFATVNSAAYRLAMLASDAGVAISKIVDGRSHPQSRFIEFCKAYGITQSPGMIPSGADWLGVKKNLAVTLQPAIAGTPHPDAPVPIPAESIIVCGGWQPDLSLWHMAGGQSRWNAEQSRLEPTEGPLGIAVAGSAAGFFSTQACLQSGRLLGEHRHAVMEHLIDPIYETPDDPTQLSDPSTTEQPATYLDAGISLIARPTAPRARRRFLPLAPVQPSWSLADQPQALGASDVAAGVQLGVIPAASAGLVAQERAASNGDLATAERPGKQLIAAPPSMIPDFLNGRFGAAPALWTIIPVEPRALEPGALIFINSDQTDPRQAIGIVIGADDNAAIAMIGKSGASPGEGATLRDQGRPVPIRLGQPYGDVSVSDAALGSEPGTA